MIRLTNYTAYLKEIIDSNLFIQHSAGATLSDFILYYQVNFYLSKNLFNDEIYLKQWCIKNQPVTFEQVFEYVPDVVKEELMFHLDLFT